MAAVIPPYGKRDAGWQPQQPEDFGGGGAYPEVHVLQHPLGLGKASGARQNAALSLQTDEQGVLRYDAILNQVNNRMITHGKPSDHKARWAREEELQRPSVEEEDKLAAETALALKQVTEIQQSTNQLARAVASTQQVDQYVRYVPDAAAPGYNPEINERIIRIVEKKVDPLEPPKFRVRRAPASRNSPPPPLQRKPAKKLTPEELAAWKLPPCVSNWKNQSGYTIPLEMRLQADGRGLREVAINPRFAQFSEALYIAERLAREEIRVKNDMLKQKKELEEQQREQQLREMAAKAREQRNRALD
eukprot:Gregarina_sp_Poly_1__1464@NODE_1367_length_4281_cov_300_263170_g915_i0_p2_GENE_NODE_1367_length_4281_cov_300_263170_g915_i0NODE_1367_length_4281_cov_300_263170_g915_i0_p2_ORF_typecomplete_len304_score72_63SKIP_SNW/PF02731_15/1_1e03SKIP_SNW/PF02731_15/1e55NAMassociated/PF14303_6/0_0053Homeobox_KN/PF05920_11/4_4e03Homeobox_KN/PF05920_11/0_51SMC_N/PF02463_19/6_NODE_1367_length_4281_cov_300_263170_g915_i033484259